MNRPFRGERESAATTRYVGCFVLPIRMSRSFTATVRTSFVVGGPTSVVAGPGSVQPREATIIADTGDREGRRLARRRFRALRRDPAATAFALALGLLHLPTETGDRAHAPHHLLHVVELLDERADFARLHAATGGDAPPARPVDDLRV